MATTVMTGFNPEGEIEYGAAFLKTFDRFWPAEVGLVVYTEQPVKTMYRGEERNVLAIPGLREFIESHQDPRYHGKAEVPGWGKKDQRVGYSYRYDVVKFCRQLFIPEDAANKLPDDAILAWLDGDVVTYASPPPGFIEHLMGDKDLITLDRSRGHPELGFWAIRLGRNTRAMLKDIADCYRTGDIFRLSEWHSAFVFDHWKTKYKQNGLITHKSLTNGTGHVWFQCELGRYTDHLKGWQRKKLGRSPERHGMSVRQFQ